MGAKRVWVGRKTSLGWEQNVRGGNDMKGNGLAWKLNDRVTQTKISELICVNLMFACQNTMIHYKKYRKKTDLTPTAIPIVHKFIVFSLKCKSSERC